MNYSKLLTAVILLLSVTFCLRAQTLPALPITEFDYHIPANTISAIALGMGGVNLTNAADYFSSYDNPALLAENTNTAFATSFRLKNAENLSYSELISVSNLLKDKQFMYYTLITKSAAWSYHPVSSTHISEIYVNDGITYSEYYDYQLDKLQMSIAAKDDKYAGFAGGLNIKYLTGRLVYLKQRRSGISWINIDSLIDDKVKGVSGDLGLTWTEDKYVWGACFYDVLSRLWWENYDSKSLQRRAALGFQYNSESYALMASVLGKLSNSPETTYHFGMVKNWTWKSSAASGKTVEQNLIVRAGLYSKDFNGTENISYTLGSGYNFNMFRIDFAMTNA
ncbi:MAG: hypothetical protein E4H16_03785, partial [Candidatus Atribacteria bacterium]